MSTLAESQTRFTTERHPLFLFIDGECAFCNRWAYRVKQADTAHRVRFGAKQGRTFQQVALAYPEVAAVESVVTVRRRDDGSEEVLIRSRAVKAVIDGLPEFQFFNAMLDIFPTFLADIGYRIVAKLRTALFGRWHHCRRPLEEDRELYVN